MGMSTLEPTYLKDQFLIAMPQMADPRFAHSLIYLCEHNAEGAMGLIINQPSGLNLGDVMLQLVPDLDIVGNTAVQPVFNGGPVQPERGFVLHANGQPWQATVELGVLQLTTSRDILLAMARGEGPNAALLALGYAGWGAGQLDQELADNVWLSCPADQQILFKLPADKRLQAAADKLGIDLNLLSSQAGHA
ncbi:putative transcriptional regulator [Halopseudomonas yangmingensis]|uniref:UPF0301 protein SAMN05216217_10874 n=2 Tax=Halopseudomonas yangmingensis TaxID=1720063 RepID=A0A1I4RZG2_9GAMM|nr:putative transcriptional regulator [Halopseudomonas yangmingensis]